MKYSGEKDISRHSYNKLIRINLEFQGKEETKSNQNLKKQIIAYLQNSLKRLHRSGDKFLKSLSRKSISKQLFLPIPTDVAGENTGNKKLQETEMAVEILSKIGMNHRISENGE